MKRIAFLLAAGLLCGAATLRAQEAIDREILLDYDEDGTTLHYVCLGDLVQGTDRIKTVSGGSTTVTAVAGSPFAGLAAGDQINVTVSGVRQHVTISTWTSATSIVVSSSVTWYNAGSGYTFSYRKLTNSTSDDACWVNVSTMRNKILTIEYNQGDLTDGLSFRVEGKIADAALPHRIYPSSSTDCVGIAMTYSAAYCNLPTASIGADDRVDIVDMWPYKFIRVGIKAVTADPSDASTNLEKISIFLHAENPR